MSPNNDVDTSSKVALPTNLITTTESSIPNPVDSELLETSHDPLETANLSQSLPLTAYNTRQHHHNNGRRQVLSASLSSQPFLPIDRIDDDDDDDTNSAASPLLQASIHPIAQMNPSDNDDIDDRERTTATTAVLPSLDESLDPSISHIPPSNRHTIDHTSYFTTVPSNDHISSSNSPRPSQRDSLGSAGWRRLRRYIMHHQPNWAHTSPGNDLPPLPLPMTPGHVSTGSASTNHNHNNRNSVNPFGVGLIDWQDNLEPVVHVVLDDGTIQKRRMTSRSFSESE
jgi:hypothetical protein